MTAAEIAANDNSLAIMMGAVIAVLLFCLCCYRFLRELSQPVPFVNQSIYSKAALRVEKSYKVFSWGLLMCVFMVGLVISFGEVFTKL